jgi:hypothetical protein
MRWGFGMLRVYWNNVVGATEIARRRNHVRIRCADTAATFTFPGADLFFRHLGHIGVHKRNLGRAR